jgi:hypothetical protein
MHLIFLYLRRRHERLRWRQIVSCQLEPEPSRPGSEGAMATDAAMPEHLVI